MEKRRAALADRVLAARHLSPLYPAKMVDQLKRSVRAARRFILDDEATKRLVDVIYDLPDLLAREQQFARAPYDRTWIEYSGTVFYDRMVERNLADDKKYPTSGSPETSDSRVGYLVDHGQLSAFAGGTRERPDDGVVVTPIQYHMNTEWPLEDQLRFAQDLSASRMTLGMFLWGSTWTKISPDHQRQLRDNTALEMRPTVRNLTARQKVDALGGGVGDLRNAIALLLMLNRPSVAKYVEVPASRGWHKNKVLPFMSHTSVSVSFDAVSTIRLVGTAAGEGVERRRHEVRGHYCHDQIARDNSRLLGCVHEFAPVDDEWLPFAGSGRSEEVTRWTCSACGGKRWWRQSHERGTAQVGFVAHDDYLVGA